MTSDGLELFKEKVRNKPIEYLLEMRECLFRMKERIEKDYRREDTKLTYAKYINFRYVIRGDIAKKLDIINEELKRKEGEKMTSDELELFKEKVRKMTSDELKKEVRNATKEHLLQLKEYFEREYRAELHSLENSEHIPTYHVLKVDYLDWLGDIAKKLDVINARLRIMEYVG